mgnify:CR=1 FL=1
MITDLLSSIDKIYIAYGASDFRKQINSLCQLVKENFNMDPYNRCAYIFCNRKRTSIKVLCYDKNRLCISSKNIT